jgi:hypothetical protein
MAKSASTTETKAHSPPNDGEFPQPVRAYLGIDGVSDKGIPGGITVPLAVMADNDFSAIIHGRNYGKTPAYNISIRCRIAAADFPLTVELPPYEERHFQRGAIINPSQSVIIPMGERIPATPASNLAVITGKYATYVFGEINFVDVFGDKQWVRFRFFTQGTNIENASFQVHHEGNDAS